MAKLLVQYGAKTIDGKFNVFVHLTREDNAELLGFVLKHDTNPVLKATLDSATEEAIWARSLSCLRILIEHGADISGPRIILFAIFRKDLECIDLLCRMGMEINTTHDDSLNTALHSAVKYKAGADVVRILLAYNPDLRALNGRGFTPLTLARRIGAHEIERIFEDAEEQRLREDHLAFAMGQHRRLGDVSSSHWLDEES
ncbi:ankyrin repeat-containing domain protein [Baffinella frigidus]|nr:ankyrin repeat-containing domain protein [Cryptophyta sp. CCMP2293]